MTVSQLIQQLGECNPNATACVFDRREQTYREITEINQYDVKKEYGGGEFDGEDYTGTKKTIYVLEYGISF